MVIEPVRVPVAVGVKVTPKAQFAPAVRVPVQVLAGEVAMAKSPLGATEIVVFTVPVFFTVTLCAGLVVPTACEPNVRLVGVGATTGAPATRKV